MQLYFEQLDQEPKAVSYTHLDVYKRQDYISGYSLYSYEREMSQGYITIEGGHRVGLSGQAIMENRCV